MNEILEQYNKSGDIHHFYILEGDKDSLEEKVSTFLQKEANVDTSDKSLFYCYDFDKFFVEDSRNICSQSQIKTPQGKKMVFVIYANSITHQAQNALLKNFEEPTERTYFFIILPNVENLLPTFVSRSVLIKNPERNSGSTLKDLRKMTPGDRMKFVEDLVKDIKDEKREKIEAQKLVRNLIIDFEAEILADSQKSADNTNGADNTENANKKNILKTLVQIEDFLGDSGASVKILLERAVLLI